jgi:hypothetical protein
MPPPLPLTSERLERHGLFLIEDGQTIFLWIGRDAVPQLVMDVFNLPSYDVLRGGKVSDAHLVVVAFWSHVYHCSADYIARARQRIQPADQRHHPEDTRDEAWCVLPTSLRRQGGRRTTTPAVGPQLSHPRSCGCLAELPTVHHAVKREGLDDLILNVRFKKT